ncbi:hypothetical protein C8R47DRAFT_1281820 [Mycena vitilis]|nr:hypothetical protein C8R47DRAFT_1281820 [Mycena vitilis]
MHQPHLPHRSDPSTQYRVSRKFLLYQHEAPTKPAGERNSLLFSDADRQREINGGRLDNCRLYTVQPLSPHPTLEVVLEQPLTTRYAQVWKVQCEGRTMVARFYDPLFAAASDKKFDVFRRIDRAVAMEVHAYKALQDLQGILVPRFVGCFLTMVAAAPNALQEKRSVQVILLDFVPGQDLHRYKPGDGEPVCDTHKVAVLDAILLANYLFLLRGIQHADLAGRNVILKDSALSSTPFCNDASCQLRFRFPSHSLVQSMNALGGPEADYSKLTLQQLESLPITVIDFEEYQTIDERLERFARITRHFGGRSYSRKDIEGFTTPESQRKEYMQMWAEERLGWLPNTAYDKT